MSGIYFTPHALVGAMLERCRALLGDGPVNVVDPSSGGGAFLAEAARVLPRATLLGLELHPEIAAACRARLPSATILGGNALIDGFEALLTYGQPSVPTLFVGNPPYNGTSPLLSNARRRAQLQALVGPLPRGNSLRDDFAFFLLLAAAALEDRPGALAFVTPSSLLDAFLYAPLRRHLLHRLDLVEVWELGRDVFRGTQVRTCVTFWRSGGSDRRPVYRSRGSAGAFAQGQLTAPEPLRPTAPDWLLRPVPSDASALHADWMSRGAEPITSLIPVSFPGLKTRFDELLTDSDPDVLFARVDDFLRAHDLEAFRRRHRLDAALLPKLEALRRSVPAGLDGATRSNLRHFHRYAGARHRGELPESAAAFCYLDRRLIPRGDHRLNGAYDPHLGDFKLIFNLRELPLSAAILDREGCVHDHRHARFAPLYVPERVRDEGIAVARRTADLGPPVPNLSPRGLERAPALGGEARLYEAVCDFLNSGPFQTIWAPAFGTIREPLIPLDALGAR